MATLTLDAYHSLNILAPISITGGGGLVLQYNDAATDGVLSFGLGSTGFAGSVAFTDVVGSDTQGGLTINGLAYTLAEQHHPACERYLVERERQFCARQFLRREWRRLLYVVTHLHDLRWNLRRPRQHDFEPERR